MPSTMILLVTGDGVEVDGTLEDVQKQLQDAVRSSPGTLARLTEQGSGEPVALNPAHVLTLRRGSE